MSGAWHRGPSGPAPPEHNILTDREDNRFSARAARYMRVGTNVGSVAAKVAGQRLFGLAGDHASNAADLAAALGGLKGPIMKVAQLLSTGLLELIGANQNRGVRETLPMFDRSAGKGMLKTDLKKPIWRLVVS